MNLQFGLPCKEAILHTRTAMLLNPAVSHYVIRCDPVECPIDSLKSQDPPRISHSSITF